MRLVNVRVQESLCTYWNSFYKRVRWYNCGRYPAYSFALRTAKMHEKNLTDSLLFGGGAGSTAGGVKASRIVLLCKSLRRDLRRVMHSREVRPITLDGHRVTEETVSSVSVFFFAYIAIMLLGTLILSLDNIDFTAAFTASLTAISNVGPGLGAVGPTCNFGFLSGISKLTMSAIMLPGRLEIMPLLVLLMPSVWRRK